MKHALPDAELKVFPNSSHMPFYEEPEAYYPVLLDFLGRHAPGGRTDGRPEPGMHRYRFVLHRPLQLLPVLFGISVVTFVLVHSIPGDPVRTSSAPRRRRR